MLMHPTKVATSFLKKYHEIRLVFNKSLPTNEQRLGLGVFDESTISCYLIFLLSKFMN